MTRLAILWHMHQPYYEDLATGEHVLPWVRLHAIKDYVGMVSVVREFPAIRATFNLVPSLLVQVQAFAENRAHDRHLAIGLKDADRLDAAERRLLVENGFHAPVAQMIRPYPRYAELHARRRQPESFTPADLRDLQVWHKLAWMDHDWLRRDPRLARLVEKGHGFDEADKATLREVEVELLNAVIPAYAEAGASGQIELSTSPFYHPILPLVCDTDTHLAGSPLSALPRGLFRHPEDAREQLRRAVDLHTRLFGGRPRGVWPSEGAVSDDTLRLLAESGFAWTATDQEILARSRRAPATSGDLYRPYEWTSDEGSMRVLFRDHDLSDLIGFAYQSWEPEAAARDFVAKVRDAGRRHRDQDPASTPTIVVILDGENAWEHYPAGGRPFLRALYARLAEAADIQTVTMSDAATGPARPLSRVFPGSWINGDFYIWAGHADDHRAWGQLARARTAFEDAAPEVPAAQRELAYSELLVAEGSDWFWWYGDDHSSDHDRVFDGLFRRHLRNVYRALGRPAPDDLHVSNITTAPTPADGRVWLSHFMSPIIDGCVTHVAEWGASHEVPLGGGGTMHRAGMSMVRELRVGVSRTALFIRLDGVELLRRRMAEQISVVLLMDRPRTARLALGDGPGSGGTQAAAADILEAAVPFAALGVQPGDRVSLSVLVVDAVGHVLEQHPATHPMELDVPTRHLEALNWSV